MRNSVAGGTYRPAYRDVIVIVTEDKVMNAVDIILLVVIAGAVCAAAAKLIRNRKKGRCSCGCEGCSGCGRAKKQGR